ncbi:hypothetical protein L210DRAFT_3649637 [Boletus edulis BED1]|uniref:Uncharacterized protein n=1 Tax=Boletus edulis BED1 TaxID=1328754 RepID=A0AAD4GBB1_BOLED|nr:hypothetical protein L210DRAFT_3649637 [Boletus edulis BED1]
MDDDVDMDAPLISTLPQAEATPPPSRGSKFRVKLLVGDKKGKGKSSPPDAARKSVPQNQTQPQPQSEEEVDEEDEEDQLIDDEPTPSISAPVATGTKRKAPPKKSSRPRKTEKQDKEDKKPDEPREPPDTEGQSVSTAALSEKPTPKKRAAPRKTAAASKPKAKVPPKGAKLPTVPPVEDTAMSETHTITAPPSPFPVSRAASPEPEAEEVEQPPPPAPEQPGESAPLALPVYPLPSKPFPVQPPPKIGTGFAPVQPLDRSGGKVRQWRIANREIRGIAGGRWFTRSWVGDKESDFATALATTSAATTAKVADSDKIAVPKAVTSISAPGLGKAGKSKGVRGSAGISATPSRSGSIVPDLRPPKAPTKMRNIIAGPASEAGDEPDIAVPEPRGISTVS